MPETAQTEVGAERLKKFWPGYRQNTTGRAYECVFRDRQKDLVWKISSGEVVIARSVVGKSASRTSPFRDT
jgi:hypothetical protein